MLITVEKADRPGWCGSQALPGASCPTRGLQSTPTRIHFALLTLQILSQKDVGKTELTDAHRGPGKQALIVAALLAQPSTLQSRRDLFHGLTTALHSPEETTHHHSFFFGSNPRAQRAWFSSSAPTSSFYKVFAFCSHELKTLQGTPLVSQGRGTAGRETEPCPGGI